MINGHLRRVLRSHPAGFASKFLVIRVIRGFNLGIQVELKTVSMAKRMPQYLHPHLQPAPANQRLARFADISRATKRFPHGY